MIYCRITLRGPWPAILARMTADLERVRSTIDRRRPDSAQEPQESSEIDALTCWFDLGTSASVMCLAVTPHPLGALVPIGLFILGRGLLARWATSASPVGDAERYVTSASPALATACR